MKKLSYEPGRHIRAPYIDCYQVSEQTCSLTQEQALCCDYYEIIRIESGAGVVEVDEHRTPFKAGDFIFSQPFQLRRFQGGLYTSTNLIFYDTFFQSFFVDARFLAKIPLFYAKDHFVVTFNEMESAFFETAFKELIEILSDRSNPNVEHITRSLLYYLLSKASGSKAIERVAYSSEIIELKALIEKHYLEETSIKFYASKMQCGANKIHTLCSKYYVQSFSKILKQRLVLEAKKELLHSSKSISEIAFSLNFSDASNFTRFFKHQTGVKPLQFRNR